MFWMEAGRDGNPAERWSPLTVHQLGSLRCSPAAEQLGEGEKEEGGGVVSERRRWSWGKELVWTRIGPVTAGQRWSNLIWREIKRPLGYSHLETPAALVSVRIPSAESENAAVSDGRRAWPRPAAASAQEPTETLLRHTESPDTTAALSTLLSLLPAFILSGKYRRCHPVRSANLFHKRTDELQPQKR